MQHTHTALAAFVISDESPYFDRSNKNGGHAFLMFTNGEMINFFFAHDGVVVQTRTGTLVDNAAISAFSQIVDRFVPDGGKLSMACTLIEEAYSYINQLDLQQAMKMHYLYGIRRIAVLFSDLPSHSHAWTIRSYTMAQLIEKDGELFIAPFFELIPVIPLNVSDLVKVEVIGGAEVTFWNAMLLQDRVFKKLGDYYIKKDALDAALYCSLCKCAMNLREHAIEFIMSGDNLSRITHFGIFHESCCHNVSRSLEEDDPSWYVEKIYKE